MIGLRIGIGIAGLEGVSLVSLVLLACRIAPQSGDPFGDDLVIHFA